MVGIIRFIKNWTLPISLFLGIVGYKWFSQFTYVTPYLIFCMLLLTFSKVSRKDLHLKWWHLWLIIIEVGGAIGIYLLLEPINHIVAESLMICVICPTATAAAVITGKLGGNIANITTYKLICNSVVALAIPIIFPIIEIGGEPETGFFSTFTHMLSKILPLLILPFILAEFMRATMPKVIGYLQKISGLGFYLWALGLIVVTAQTVNSLFILETSIMLIVYMAAGSLILCLVQFFLGRALGEPYGDQISAGQALGQKNTILAIWMTHTYLNPLASIGPGAYVLWQNLFNSYQIWHKRKKDREAAKQQLLNNNPTITPEA